VSKTGQGPTYEVEEYAKSTEKKKRGRIEGDEIRKGDNVGKRPTIHREEGRKRGEGKERPQSATGKETNHDRYAFGDKWKEEQAGANYADS